MTTYGIAYDATIDIQILRELHKQINPPYTHSTQPGLHSLIIKLQNWRFQIRLRIHQTHITTHIIAHHPLNAKIDHQWQLADPELIPKLQEHLNNPQTIDHTIAKTELLDQITTQLNFVGHHITYQWPNNNPTLTATNPHGQTTQLTIHNKTTQQNSPYTLTITHDTAQTSHPINQDLIPHLEPQLKQIQTKLNRKPNKPKMKIKQQILQELLQQIQIPQIPDTQIDQYEDHITIQTPKTTQFILITPAHHLNIITSPKRKPNKQIVAHETHIPLADPQLIPKLQETLNQHLK